MRVTLSSVLLSSELGEAVRVLNWCLDSEMGWMQAKKLRLSYDKAGTADK